MEICNSFIVFMFYCEQRVCFKKKICDTTVLFKIFLFSCLFLFSCSLILLWSRVFFVVFFFLQILRTGYIFDILFRYFLGGFVMQRLLAVIKQKDTDDRFVTFTLCIIYFFYSIDV